MDWADGLVCCGVRFRPAGDRSGEDTAGRARSPNPRIRVLLPNRRLQRGRCGSSIAQLVNRSSLLGTSLRLSKRPSRPRDRDGRELEVGDVVRIVGVPPLAGMSDEVRRDCLPVFEHLVGTYRTIAEFDDFGFAGFWFTIRQGEWRGRHFVAIEPELLKKRDEKRRAEAARRRPAR